MEKYRLTRGQILALELRDKRRGKLYIAATIVFFVAAGAMFLVSA